MKLIKLIWTNEKNQSSTEWINVDIIKTIRAYRDANDKIIGSAIFYMSGVPCILDYRSPEELANYINNLK